MGEDGQERPLVASPSKLRVDAPSFRPSTRKAVPPVQTNLLKLFHKLDAVPFTPSQGVLSPTPSNMATLWYQHQHTYMESPSYHQHYPHTPMYPVPMSPAAWPQVVQRSVSLGAMPQWPPTMQSAPVSPAVAFTPSHMSQGWQMQPHPATFQWPQSPQPIVPSRNGFGGYPHSPMQHIMAPQGPTDGSYLVLMQPPPSPVHVPVMSRPATSPAPLGILRHSPEHSDRGSQSPSPASREAGSSSRGMNQAFLSALHHNNRAIGDAMQQLTAAEPGMLEQLQAAVTPLQLQKRTANTDGLAIKSFTMRTYNGWLESLEQFCQAVAELQHLMECHGVFPGPAGKSLDITSLKSSWSPRSTANASKVICTGDRADRNPREHASFKGLGQSMQWSGGREPLLNARARRTLKRALKRAVAELSAAGVLLTSTLRPLPYSGGDASADRNSGPHDAASVTGAGNSKNSLESESLASSSPSARTTRQSSPHLCEKCGTQSLAVTTAVAPHDSPDGSAGSELSDSNSDIDRPPEENVTADGANARHRHAESEAGHVRALSGKPGKRELQQPKIRITVNAARRLPKPIITDSDGDELHREGE